MGGFCYQKSRFGRHFLWKDFVYQRAVLVDIFYGLKTLCRFNHLVSALVSVCVSQVGTEV